MRYTTMILLLGLIFSFAQAQSLIEILRGDSGQDFCVNQRELYPVGTKCQNIGGRQVCLDEFRAACAVAKKMNAADFRKRAETAGQRSSPEETEAKPIAPYVEKELVEKDDAAVMPDEPVPSPLPESGVARKMTDKQASTLYKDFTAEQLPTGAEVEFTDWAIPPNGPCANTREKDLPGGKLNCTACSAKANSDVRRLGTYTLDHVTAARNYVYQKTTLVMTLKGKFDDVTLKCSPIDAMPTTPEVTAALARVGIKLTFPYPKEATLRVTPAAGAAPTSAF